MKYFIKTYGCQMNESDSERIASFLENKGYKSVKGADSSAEALAKADLIVVNACSVRQTAIDRILGLKPKIQKLQKTKSACRQAGPKLQTILTGCVLKSDKRKFEEFFDSVIPIYHLLSDRKKDGINYFKIKPKCKKKNSAFVPIMTGCDNFCSYCVVPYVRDREKSRPIKEILREVKTLIKQGHKEIILLGQNVNSYEYGFSKLLQKLNTLPGKFTIKFLTNHPKDFSDELIETIAKCKKIAKEIHLPIQSGDNQILKKMNRGYTVEQYKKLVKKIRLACWQAGKKIPDVKISTDVIVGFPGETKKQFENTVKLFKEIKFSKAYINKYSPRAGTIAYKLKDDVPWNEKKRRWKVLNDIIKKRPKLIVVLGPTATGKSDLAVKLAKKFSAQGGGEIISADSRQIYKEMNIGTGKIAKKQVQSIPHYCLDLRSPKSQTSIAEYRKKALEAIDEIYKKNKIPILCGGTGLYIQAVVEGLNIPKIKPDWKLRRALENKTTEQLFNELKKLDPNRAKNIDAKNKRRLIRAIEIILKTGKPIPSLKSESKFDVLYLGIKKPLPELKKAINQRVDKMIKMGLQKEVKKLTGKYGWTAVLKNTIGYAEFSPYAKASEDKERIVNLIKVHSLQFAKRQMTWFNKYPGEKINWVKTPAQAEKLAKKFLS